MLARRAMAFEIAVALLAASVAFGYKSDFDVAVFDEGLALYGGMRVGGGDVPYRDFWTTYAPGSYYLAAGAFDVFGASAAVVRYLWLGLHVAIAVLTLILARQLGGRRTGWLAFAIAVAATIQIDVHSGYNAVPAVAAILAALMVYALGGPAFVCGVLVGFAAVFRHDFGVYSMVGIAAGLLLRERLGERSGAGLPRFTCGVALVTFPVYGLLAWKAGVHAIVHQLVLFPATALSAYYSLPVAPGGLWFLLPAIIVLAMLAVVISQAATGRADFGSEKRIVVVPLILLALGFLNYAWMRLDRLHSWPVMIATVPLIAAAPSMARSVNLRRRVDVVVVGLVGLYTLLASATLVAKKRIPVIPLTAPRGLGLTIPAAVGSYNDLVLAVRSATKPGEPIFSGAIRHDAILFNDVLLYFLAERPAATPYYELNRGLMADARVQAEIVRALEERSVRVVVLLDKLSDEPNRSAASNGVTLLDDYIRKHFRAVRAFGDYRLLSRETPG